MGRSKYVGGREKIQILLNDSDELDFNHLSLFHLLLNSMIKYSWDLALRIMASSALTDGMPEAVTQS